MDSGYDSWGEGDDATPTMSAALGTHKRARDAAASDDHSRGTAATESGLVPGPVPAFAEPPPKPAAMYDVVKKLQAKDKHGVFAEPVTEAIAPGYFSVVSTPMDFRTLRENVRLGKYQSWDAFVQELELIFANAMAYNPAGTAVHALAAKTLEHARRAAEKARNAGLSPGARAKRLKMAHVASLNSFGGDERSVFSMGTNGVSNILSMDDPSQSRGVGAPSSTGFEEEEEDDDEVGGGNDDDDKKKKKGGLRFKRHTFNELRSRTVMPSLAAWRRANALVETRGDGVFLNGKPIPETPQAMVRPSATFFQKRAAAESYAGSLASWGASLRGRARVVANRLARAASSLIPPPPPRAPSPPPREPSPARAEEDEPSALVAAENDDGSESDDDVSLISIANKVRGATIARVAPILPAANAQKSLALAAAAAAASQRASASVKTAGLISRGQVAPESRGDPLPALRAQLGLPPDGGFADVVRGVHADLSRGLGLVRDRLRGVGFGKDHPIVPAPPPLPATRRRT
jgi:bromodomain-containing protein 7/9